MKFVLEKIIKNEKFWILVIFTIFTILYLLNYPLKNLVYGWDMELFFFNTDYFFNNLYLWSNNAPMGGPSTGILHIFSISYILFIKFLNSFLPTNLSFHLFNYLFFILIPLSFFKFLSVFQLKNIDKFLLSFFYSLHFLTWQIFSRNLIFLNIFLITTPILLYFFHKIIVNFKQTQSFSKQDIVYFILTCILNLPAFTNPAFSFFQIVLIFFWAYFYFQKYNLNFKNSPLFSLFFLYLSPFLLTILTFYFFAFSNLQVAKDAWNMKTLLSDTLVGHRTSQALQYSVAGLNQDLFTSDGFLNGAKFHPFAGYKLFSNPLIIFFVYTPIFIIIAHLFKFRKNPQFIYWFCIFLFCIFLFKSSAPPFGFLLENGLNNVNFLSIFRNIHQKTSLLYLFSTIILLAIILHKNNHKFLRIILFISTILPAFYYFLGQAVPPTINLQNYEKMLTTYQQTSQQINKNPNLYGGVILPFTKKTWVENDFGFEGYHPLEKLGQKPIYNIGQNTNNLEARNIENALEMAEKFNPDFTKILQKNAVNFIIYDSHINPKERFKYEFNHNKNQQFLDNLENLEKIWNKDGVKIYKILGEEQKLEKINGAHYFINKTENLIKTDFTYTKNWIKLEKNCKQNSFCVLDSILRKNYETGKMVEKKVVFDNCLNEKGCSIVYKPDILTQTFLLILIISYTAFTFKINKNFTPKTHQPQKQDDLKPHF